MKLSLPSVLFLACVLPLAAVTNPGDATQASPALKQTKSKDGQVAIATPSKSKSANSAAVPTAAAPATPTAAATTANTLTLALYLQALADAITLSKDEKTDIATYYLEDGTQLQQILNDDSLSPLQQTAKVDDLRDTRNAKIEALLRDVDRQVSFQKIEAGYRVALIELAANGGLVPATPPPNVPQPTATPPGKAEKTEIPGSPPQESSIKKS